MAAFVFIHGAGDAGWHWHLVAAELRERGHDTGDDWQRDDLVFAVPSEQAGVGNPPPLPIPNFADSVVTVVPATIQNDDPDDPVGWGIDNADSVIDGNGNIQVTARIVAKGEGATVLRAAYHAVILG